MLYTCIFIYISTHHHRVSATRATSESIYIYIYIYIYIIHNTYNIYIWSHADLCCAYIDHPVSANCSTSESNSRGYAWTFILYLYIFHSKTHYHPVSATRSTSESNVISSSLSRRVILSSSCTAASCWFHKGSKGRCEKFSKSVP
jgi:hypothetical protein